MQCCICGDDLQDDDMVIRILAYRYKTEGPSHTLLRSRFDNGLDELLAHGACAVFNTGSMGIIGATGDRTDE